MPVLKIYNDAPYTRVPNTTVRDERLELDEIGALTRLLSYSDDYEFDVNSLCSRWKIGRERLARITKHLKQFGYLKITTRHDGGGKFDGKIWVVSGLPQSSWVLNHDTANPAHGETGDRDTGLPAHGVNRETENPAHSLKEKEDLKEREDKKDLKEKEECPAEEKIQDQEGGKNGSAENIRAVFDNWREITRRPGVFLSPKLQAFLKGRLDEGFTVEHLRLAAEGNSVSPHHAGINDRHTVYNDISLIYRSDADVWRFIGMATNTPERRNTRGPGAPSTTDSPPVPITRDKAKGHALTYGIYLGIDERHEARSLDIEDSWLSAWFESLQEAEEAFGVDVARCWFKPLMLLGVNAARPVIHANETTAEWIKQYYLDGFQAILAAHGFGPIIWEVNEHAGAEEFKASFSADDWAVIEKEIDKKGLNE